MNACKCFGFYFILYSLNETIRFTSNSSLPSLAVATQPKHHHSNRHMFVSSILKTFACSIQKLDASRFPYISCYFCSTFDLLGVSLSHCHCMHKPIQTIKHKTKNDHYSNSFAERMKRWKERQ